MLEPAAAFQRFPAAFKKEQGADTSWNLPAESKIPLKAKSTCSINIFALQNVFVLH